MDSGDADIPTYQPIGDVHVSPNSGRRTFIPDVDDSIKPQMHMTYAKAGGFTARKGTQHEPQKGVIHNKHFLSSKEGTKPFKAIDSTQEAGSSNDNSKTKINPRVPSIRTGYEAGIRVKLTQNNLYEVYYFEGSHNHSFVAEYDRYLLPENRGINYVQEEAVNTLSAINVGPVRAFNNMRTLYGGFNKVGATKVDFKNFKSDLNMYIAEYDADMVIKRLRRKKEFMPNFSMEYLTTDDGILRALFWADGDTKRNFHMFGDVVSFDATYHRNKYNMMFVPFTGIDNHYRNVTLGAAIIGNEIAEAYSWLLNAFRQAFGRAPPVIVTDQDLAMRKAIQDTWPESRHSLCMWHIMDKLTTKFFISEYVVGANLCNSTDFKKRLCGISIYQIRDTWIPAYYRDEHMSGLMRTSSRSESENHFFGQFCNPNCMLVEFLGHFDSVIEAQRHEHRKNDHDTRHTNPEIFAKEFVLEQQAANIYTRTIFFDAQLEIRTAIHKCGIGKWDEREDNFVNFSVKDFSQTCTTFFQVMMRQLDMTMSCSCNRQFPERYIMRRWTREAVPNSAPRAILGINESDDRYQQVNGVVREIKRDHVVQYQLTPDQAVVNAPPRSRRDRFAEITGYTQETPVIVRMSKTTRFKGMGNPTRRKSKREIAISQSGKKRVVNVAIANVGGIIYVHARTRQGKRTMTPQKVMKRRVKEMTKRS
ncbi:protein FAR1-RELATED SEQUENCE 5-like [Helianthus annuus]|uniref:protein FAR1-RELATED SEQUENCE 5-like n=1 Tax=Helianthus annuus TaxID=4232 RepID=UPI000B907DEA|nr:protein FAR1-RELATED SEQUENCE 5-like [Helianthus annuus]